MNTQALQQSLTAVLNNHNTQTREVNFSAQDGFELSGTLFIPQDQPRATLMISSGTGIPRRFYTAFAAYLASHGYLTLTYDFRGIGGSRPPQLAGFQATKRDWGKLDMSAAFNFLEQEAPNIPHYVFGHSVGGQLIGLMQDPQRIDAIVTYGSGFGYWGNIKGAYRYFVWLMWYLGIPLSTRLFRYMPAKSFKLGEDLPSGVAQDWARWGKLPHYFSQELKEQQGFQAIHAPWKAILASDDKIATKDNALPLYALYQHAQIDVEIITPQQFSYEELGHLNFFSRSKRDAWHIVPQWLDQQASRHKNLH
ncbi:MAG: alpha/beta fold hydrolase [Myxococcales bacterium]|nr:alpha/beta fold hydrolase [Myxococcales bacterium]